MKEQILANIDKIVEELKKGNDIQLKAVREEVKMQSLKVKRI